MEGRVPAGPRVVREREKGTLDTKLVGSFGNLWNPLQSLEKTEGRAVCVAQACGPHTIAFRRIPGLHGAMTSHVLF